MQRIIWIIVLIVIAGTGVFLLSRPEPVSSLDGFAQCLTERGYLMYGAYWCPHCQNEKNAFGSSWKYVNYIECAREPKRCTDPGIKGFPTWIGPDNTFLEGEQGVLRLSEVSGCPIGNEKVKN